MMASENSLVKTTWDARPAAEGGASREALGHTTLTLSSPKGGAELTVKAAVSAANSGWCFSSVL